MTRETTSERKENMGKEPKELAQLVIISNDQTLFNIKATGSELGGVYRCMFMYACVCERM